MAVPEEVRKVPRPKGTVVCDGKNGKYPVREKLSGGYYVDEDGKPHRPSRNGRVVGHIVNMVFVPKRFDEEDSVAQGDVDLKDWANVYLFDLLNRDLLDALEAHYNEGDSLRLYIMAMLRAVYEGIPDRTLKRQYEETFLSEMYDEVKLSRNSVSTFLRNVGRNCSRITGFMRSMVSKVGANDHLIIDGSLRQDHSRVNSLSAVSRKTRNLGYKQILLMYAYDLERKEPVCSKVYPGNMVDRRVILDFVKEFDISRGVIVADKGFPPEAVKEAVKACEDLHYLVPLIRGRTVIDELDLYRYDQRLEGESGIQCRRVSRSENGRPVWYYSFRDPSIALDEEILYMSQHTGKDFDPEDLEKRRAEFGTIVFESDLEMGCGKAYEIYGSRWIIELFFRTQEDAMEMDDTREHSDYSVIASNFVDYLSSIMCSRVLCYLDDRKLLDKNTYGDIMDLLARLKMTRITSESEWMVRRIALVDLEIVEALGLLHHPIVPEEKKKRGRPKGSKDSKPRKRKRKVEVEADSA